MNSLFLFWFTHSLCDDYIFTMEREQAQKEIIDLCQRLDRKDYLCGLDGDVSVKLEDGTVMITPLNRHKGFIQEDDLCLMTVEGDALSGTPSLYSSLHLKIYSNILKASCIIHAFPLHCCFWPLAFKEINEISGELLIQLQKNIDNIPIVPYARPGTPGMAYSLEPFLKREHQAMLLKENGVLVWGKSSEECFSILENVERSLQILTQIKHNGKIELIPEEEVEFFRRQLLNKARGIIR